MLCALVLALVLIPCRLPAAQEFSGALTSSTSPPGLNAQQLWRSLGFDTIGWDVSQNSNGSWHYVYGLSVPALTGTSFIVQLPTQFTSADILNATGTFTSFSVGTFSPGAQFPFLPAAIHGVDFAITEGTDTQVAFDANIQPDFGNFYAQGGNEAVSNAGFLIPNVHHSPANGSVSQKVLVPDTTPEPVADASTLVLASIGAAPAFVVIRKRRR